MSRFSQLTILIFILLQQAVAQEDPKTILDGVYAKFKLVNDYQADVKIKTEIPFINILPIGATIYFKQPDKIRVKAKGIAILPRQGFDQIFKMLGDGDRFTYVMQGSDAIGSSPVSIINVIPNDDTSDVVLAKLWIENANHLIRRAQLTSKTNGTVTMDYTYGKHIAYALPDSIRFSVDVKKFKIPKAVAADLNKPTSQGEPKKDDKKGKILLRFENYVINKGIDDRIFDQRE